MEVDGWSLIRFLHVTGAAVWVGGQLLLSLVITPLLRREVDEAERARLLGTLGRRFGVITAGVVLPLQIATGVAMMAHRQVGLADLDEPGYGRTLGLKLVLVAAMVVVAIVHGVYAARGRHRVSRPLGVVSLVLSLGVLVLATALVG